MWKHASLSRVLFPSPDRFPMLEAGSAVRSPRARFEKSSRERSTHWFRARFFIPTIPFLFFLFFSPVIAAIYYNRDIIAKVWYISNIIRLEESWGKFKATICGNTPPWVGCVLSRFLASFSIVFVIDKNLSLFRETFSMRTSEYILS